MGSPNIVFILIDDMGWRDLGCYGSSFYETPQPRPAGRAGRALHRCLRRLPGLLADARQHPDRQVPGPRLGLTDWIDWAAAHTRRAAAWSTRPTSTHLPLEEHTLAHGPARAAAMPPGTWASGTWASAAYCPTEHGFDVNIGGCDWGTPDGRATSAPGGSPRCRMRTCRRASTSPTA